MYRYPKNETGFLIKKKNRKSKKNVYDFKKKYSLHDYIKLTSKDFNLINKKKRLFHHFNLEWTGHKKGRLYLIVRILKKGSFDGKFYKPPIISSKKVFLVKCLGTRNNIPYENLKKQDFVFSLKNIKNKNKLKQTIIRRYKKSLPHFKKNELINLGVAITKLSILQESSLSSFLK